MKALTYNTKQLHNLFTLLLICHIMVSGCGSGSSRGNKSNTGKNVSTYLYGIASKGPIKNGFVVAYPLSPSGVQGVALNTAFTSDDGSYILDTENYSGNLLVTVTGGAYTDETTGNNASDKGLVLRAAITRINGNAVVMVTPYTEVAVQMALSNGGLTEANIDRANTLSGTIAGGVDITNTRPANILLSEEVSSSSAEEIQYGLALGMISQMAHDHFSDNVQTAVSNISSDLRDYTLDVQDDTLLNSLQAFISNTNNKSGVNDLSHTDIDEALALASTASFSKDSNEINQVFNLLEVLYAAEGLSDTDIREWFNNNIADDYLHDGRIKADEADIWTAPGGLYQGVSLSAVLVSPMNTGTGYDKGYWIRVNFSGNKGQGSILSSIVYNGSKWLWHGNREWGVSLSNLLPHAEMVVAPTGEYSITNGFDMVIWDYNLSAYNHGIRSAIIKGPGLGEGVILEHYYRTYQPASYLSLYPRGSGYRYPLTDDIINTIPDNAEYTISYYTESANELSLSAPPPAVRAATKSFAKKPYLSSELTPSIFPVLASDSHDLSSLNVGGQVNVSWTNPVDSMVNFASLSWNDVNGDEQSVVEYPESALEVQGGVGSVAFDTTTKPAAGLSGQIYLRGEDRFGRGTSLVWKYWRQSGSAEEVNDINDIFHGLEQIYATPKTEETELSEVTDWFNNYAASDYLHDGRKIIEDIKAWTGAGGLYEGISIYAVIIEPDPGDTWGQYQKGYRVMLYFSGDGGSVTIPSSMVFNGNKWLWYGNREWGLGLSDFVPWAEKTIDVNNNVTFDTGFEVIIWDAYLAAYNQGVRSAILNGPGLGDGIKLAHCYNQNSAADAKYFSLAADNKQTCSGTFNKSLTDDLIGQIHDNDVYNIYLYTDTADVVSLNSAPIKTWTRTFSKGPLLKTELLNDQSNPGLYFPVLHTPAAHLLSDAHIPGTLYVSWTNPDQMPVNYVSLGWLDMTGTASGMKSVNGYPTYNTGTQEGQVSLVTEGTATWFANLYLRGEDVYNRRYSVTWEFQDSSFLTTQVPP